MPIDPYATIKPFFTTTAKAGLTDDDALRVLSYEMYERFYWNVPETYKIVARSEDATPIYLPSARNMIEATGRFLAKDWGYLVNKKAGSETDQEAVGELFRKIFKREGMYAKFATQKRNGLIRGDSMWHITANPDKRPGEKLSIHELHPGQYFPIFDEDDPDKIEGCYIVDEVKDPRDPEKTVSRRQEYRKNESGGVDSALTLYELDKWDDRVDPDLAERVSILLPLEPLPTQITQIPVYHIRNFRSSLLWGSSQIRGIETILQAVNQTVSDQDLAISMQGLGVYWTNGGPPLNPDGSEGAFVLGPGEVVEVAPEHTFGRVSGIGAGLPGIEHMKYMIDAASESLGIPEVARGRADVQVAESGISLAIQMAPLLSQNAEKELELISVYDQMFYDLVNMWLPAYEAFQPNGVEVETIVGDPMPRNRQAEITELMELRAAKLITAEMAQEKLEELGYEFPEGAAALLQGEVEAEAAAVDPFAQRAADEEAVEEGNPV